MKTKHKKITKDKIVRNILLFLLGFLALGALGGGTVLIISPTGEMMGLPVSEFKNLPFRDFLTPGIILFSVLGVIPSWLIYALIKKPESRLAERMNIYNDMHWSWTFSIYIAFVLIGWIHIQLIFIQGGVYWLHTFYMFYAILIVITSLHPRIRSLYCKQTRG